jgi:hypothetical protein
MTIPRRTIFHIAIQRGGTFNGTGSCGIGNQDQEFKEEDREQQPTRGPKAIARQGGPPAQTEAASP